MNTKHTPGPWLALPASDNRVRIAGPEQADGRHTILDVPLTVSAGRTIDTDEELYANIRLIAEAHAMKSLAESFEIREPDADGIVWLVIQGIPGVRGSAMFNLGNRTNGLPLQVARLLEQDRRAILARIDGEDR